MFYRYLKRFIPLILVFMFLAGTCFAVSPKDYQTKTPQNLVPDHLYGKADIAIDAEDGEILFQKNIHDIMYPASTTKIMTLMIALENWQNLEEIVTIPEEAMNVPSDSSKVPVYAGEEMRFIDLLYGMMLKSGNDAANAVAVLVAGDVDSFVGMMNDRVVQLGLTDTHFENPHGYHHANHYTTAYDLAMITREAMKNEVFRQIAATYSYIMPATNLRSEVKISNGYSVLNSSAIYYYPYSIGVKSGYHSKSGQCFVGAAENNGARIITVMMGGADKEYRWIDTIRLSKYSFLLYKKYTFEQLWYMCPPDNLRIYIPNAAKDDPYNGALNLKYINLSNSDFCELYRDNSQALRNAGTEFGKNLEFILNDGLEAPITQGDIIGTVIYHADSGEDVTATIYAERSIAREPVSLGDSILNNIPLLKEMRDKLLPSYNPNIIYLYLGIALLIIVIIVTIVYARASKNRKRSRTYKTNKKAYNVRMRKR